MVSDTTQNTKHKASNPWLALEVRPWLVLTVVLLIAAAAMSVFRLMDYLHERRVIANGPVIDAAVLYIGRSYAREGMRDETLYVCLHYTAPDGQTYETWNDLPRRPGVLLSAKETVSVHLDPNDFHYWTAREEPPPLGLVLTVPLLCLPAAVICAAIAWLRQRSVARLIAGGTVREARISSIKLSPLAPLSKVIGVALTDGSAGRVLHCYWPSHRGPVQAGQIVQVVTDSAVKHAVIA